VCVSFDLHEIVQTHESQTQVVEVDHSYRERVHNYELHTYMYGQIIHPPAGITNGTMGGETLTDLVLAPSSTVVNFSDLQIYRIGSGIIPLLSIVLFYAE
jgi:polyribonucleotide 5'-hydroxyl-kinase